jgi:hypothetical protein
MRSAAPLTLFLRDPVVVIEKLPPLAGTVPMPVA